MRPRSRGLRASLRFVVGALLSVLAVLSAAGPGFADKPKAIGARVIDLGEDRYQFEVNIAHEDDSWEHFVDRWEIVGKGGAVLATDYMYYPRIDENIVWRALRGVKVDPGTEYVIFRLHDIRDGYGREMLVRMPRGSDRDTGWQ